MWCSRLLEIVERLFDLMEQVVNYGKKVLPAGRAQYRERVIH
jgi:hypothetical protein